MLRKDVRLLYYIADLSRLPSIATNGILCRADAVEAAKASGTYLEWARGDFSIPGVQSRRSGLHEMVPLLFNPRSPTTRSALRQRKVLMMLCVDAAVLDQVGVLICSGNAAARGAKPTGVAEGLAGLDPALVFDEPPDSEQKDPQRWHATGSEVLVPKRVPPIYLRKVVLSDEAVLAQANRHFPKVVVDPDAFSFHD